MGASLPPRHALPLHHALVLSASGLDPERTSVTTHHACADKTIKSASPSRPSPACRPFQLESLRSAGECLEPGSMLRSIHAESYANWSERSTAPYTLLAHSKAKAPSKDLVRHPLHKRAQLSRRE